MTLSRTRSSFPGMAVLAFGFAVSTVSGQTASAIPEPLQEKALTVTVQTQVAESPSSPAWEATEVKPTLPGSSVSVKLVGETLVVLVSVTPYQSPEGLVLVTQAQVWVRDQDKIHYHTALNTLRVRFGEPVAFYPLGEGKGKAPLRLIIVVNPYVRDLPPPDPVADRPENPAADTPKNP